MTEQDDCGWTGFNDVDAAIGGLRDALTGSLGDQLTGLYLAGSLATGGFDAATSDIDFVAATAGELSEARMKAVFAALLELHTRCGYWERRLEGVVVPTEVLRRYREDEPPVGAWMAGKSAIEAMGPDGVLWRDALWRGGVAITGPPAADLVEPVDAEGIREAVRGVLSTWWSEAVDDLSFLKPPAYQAFAVLSMCRALVALEDGRTVSKQEAATWCRGRAAEDWTELIDAAAEWRPPAAFDRPAEVRSFIRYTLSRAATGIG